MIPYLLAALGGYLIGDSMKDSNTFSEGGGIDSKIVSARITDMPEDFGDDMPKVYGTLDNGSEVFLFEYYPDEISFNEKEFVGLTIDEAKHLKFEKDLNYIQSNNLEAFSGGGQVNVGDSIIYTKNGVEEIAKIEGIEGNNVKLFINHPESHNKGKIYSRDKHITETIENVMKYGKKIKHKPHSAFDLSGGLSGY